MCERLSPLTCVLCINCSFYINICCFYINDRHLNYVSAPSDISSPLQFVNSIPKLSFRLRFMYTCLRFLYFHFFLVLNTSTLAPRDGWSGALYTVCSVLMIVILLFNLLFRSMSSFRGVRRTAVQMPMLRGSRGWLFSVSEAPDAVCGVHVDLACNRPLVIV